MFTVTLQAMDGRKLTYTAAGSREQVCAGIAVKAAQKWGRDTAIAEVAIMPNETWSAETARQRVGGTFGS